MMNSLETILKALSKYEEIDGESMPPAITIGNRFTGWFEGRLRFKYQFMINAYTHPPVMFDDPIRYIRKEIATELNNQRFNIKGEIISAGQLMLHEVLPFSYEDVEELEDVLNQLLAHFDLDTKKEIITHYSPEIDEDRKGYILITVFHYPYIA